MSLQTPLSFSSPFFLSLLFSPPLLSLFISSLLSSLPPIFLSMELASKMFMDQRDSNYSCQYWQISVILNQNIILGT
jgi:hypothetical protein